MLFSSCRVVRLVHSPLTLTRIHGFRHHQNTHTVAAIEYSICTNWMMTERDDKCENDKHTPRVLENRAETQRKKKKIAKWNNENLWSLMQMEIYSLIRCHHDIMQLYIIYLAHCRHTQHSQQSSRSQCEIAIHINHLCVGWQKGEFIIALQHTHAYLEFKFHLNQSK